eukprot:scaffold14071_cov105-Isochrysis_galbana.AAC.2
MLRGSNSTHGEQRCGRTSYNCNPCSGGGISAGYRASIGPQTRSGSACFSLCLTGRSSKRREGNGSAGGSLLVVNRLT